MGQVLLSIPVAFLVENALSSGESKEFIIDCLRQGNYAPLLEKSKDPDMDFADRLKTAEEMGDDWEEAIRNDYVFKFLHINGLKRLLRFRFGKEVDHDYIQENLTLRQLSIEPDKIETLRLLVSRQWNVIEENDITGEKTGQRTTVRLELKYQ
ncbi:hypothetical protein [Paenibacillus lentus]|uniref:Uncharacterized protein n=1 Tax=Paenibacillus lentus TaxID=1338368 RepID=A0A3S8RYE6_9BACL|nr:hypothetical protein [Paenibacillus lentus]AZK47950.1 hypothetical protein EIM92_18735 [Paenibacillus lentus]